MRAILGLALAAGLVASTAAAQLPDPGVTVIPQPPGERARPLGGARGSDAYEMRVIELKKLVDRVTRQDGGQLTPEHQASLQKRLDNLTADFPPPAQRPRRSSF